MAAWFLIAPLLQPVRWALCAGLLAAGLAFLASRRALASGLQALPIPLAVLAWRAGIPSWLFLAAFALTLAFGRNAWQARVPLYRSSFAAAEALAATLASGSRLLDAGAGDGRLALWLGKLRPDVRVTAMENAWGSFMLARLRWLLSGRPGNVSFRPDDFWRADWSEYDAIYVFLSPAPMIRVWEKFRTQSRPGAQLISNTFEIPGAEPQASIPLPGRLQQSLMIWRSAHGIE